MSSVSTTSISPKTLFVNMNTRPAWTKEKTMIYFPTGIAFVMSEAVRQGYDCDLLDLMVDPMTDKELSEYFADKNYDIIAMGTLSTAYNVFKPLINQLKALQPNTLFVVGNSIAAARPEQFLSFVPADVAVVGEGEQTFIEILERVKNGETLHGVKGIAFKHDGEIIREPNRVAAKKLDDQQYPIWELFDVEAYIQSAGAYKNKRLHGYLTEFRAFQGAFWTRGCPFRCTFCYNSKYFAHNPMRVHSAERVVAGFRELKEKYNINFMFLQDEVTFVTKKHAEPIVDALIEADLGIQYCANARVGFLKDGDEAFAEKLAKSGLIQLNFSLESGSPTILKEMNKPQTPEQFSTQKRILDSAGIVALTSIVLGYPSETKETLKETFDLCYDNDVFPSTGFLVPVPGSVMYDYCLEKKIITDEDYYWLHIGERQYQYLNLTQMPLETLYEETVGHLMRIRDKLNLDLCDDELICHMILDEEENEEEQLEAVPSW